MSIGNHRDGSLAVQSVKMNHGILTGPMLNITMEQPEENHPEVSQSNVKVTPRRRRKHTKVSPTNRSTARFTSKREQGANSWMEQRNCDGTTKPRTEMTKQRTMKGFAIIGVWIAMNTGCALINTEDDVEDIDITTVSITMEKGANGDWPAEVHLVRVESKTLLMQLIDSDPKEWFENKGAQKFEHAYPEAVINKWEVVPGTRIGPFDTKVYADVAAILLCNTDIGQSPIRVTQEKKITIVVHETGCEVRKNRN